MPKLLKSFLLTLFGALTLFLAIVLLAVSVKFLGAPGTSAVIMLIAIFGVSWSVVHQEMK